MVPSALKKGEKGKLAALGVALFLLAVFLASVSGGVQVAMVTVGKAFELEFVNDGGFAGFPKFSQPSHLYVFDTRDSEPEVRLMLLSLQGIVNRKEPRIYLIQKDLPGWSKGEPADQMWLDYMTSTYGIEVTHLDSYSQLMNLFIDDVKGAIVYDPSLPDTVNIATTLSGVMDSIVVHPDLMDEVSSRGIPIAEDLRGRWKDKYELYTWALENVWPMANQRMLADMRPDRFGLRDYLVANNVFTFNLRPLQPSFPREQALFLKILASTPKNIPVLGYIADHWSEEYTAVSLLSMFGKILVPTDNFIADSLSANDLTVHSGIPSADFRQSHSYSSRKPENKIYITFIISDGDNVAYDLTKMRDLWDDPLRGTIPIGWSISPVLPDVAPAVMDYFYRTASPNDYFVGSPSGAGYVYPNLYLDLESYLEISGRYFESSDLNTIWLLNVPPLYKSKLLKSYASALGLDGIFTDYMNYPLGLPNYYAGDTPIVRAAFAAYPRDAHASISVLGIWKLLAPNRPVFLFIALQAWTIDSLEDVKAVADSLDGRFVVVRPDEMVALMKYGR